MICIVEVGAFEMAWKIIGIKERELAGPGPQLQCSLARSFPTELPSSSSSVAGISPGQPPQATKPPHRHLHENLGGSPLLSDTQAATLAHRTPPPQPFPSSQLALPCRATHIETLTTPCPKMSPPPCRVSLATATAILVTGLPETGRSHRSRAP
jgi:hypothetical protein